MDTKAVHTPVGIAAVLLCAFAVLISHATPASALPLRADRTIEAAQFVLKPAIHGNRMVYVRSEAGVHSVWLEELDTGRVRMLSDPNVSADMPDIYDRHVVWQERRHDGSVIVLCDLRTLETQSLTEGHRDCAPSIWGDDVVWTRESVFDSLLMYKNVRTGYQGTLIEVESGTVAALCDGRAVHDSGGNLHLLDLRSAEQETILDSAHRTEFPDFDGDTVVYARWGESLGEICALDLTTGVSATLVSGARCAYAPAIDGDTLVWESYGASSGSQLHIARLPVDSPFASRDDARALTAFSGAIAFLARVAAHVGSLQAATLATLLG